jgi:hypothetical protein
MVDTPPSLAAAPTPESIAAELERLAAELERLAEQTGHDGCRRAARALFQDRPGQKPFNDDDMLAEANALLRDGATRSAWQAFCIVARAHGSRDQVRSIAERLRRKHSARKKSSTE